MRRPNNLKKGDLIYIVSPAKSIDPESIYFAKQLIESWGFTAECSAHTLGKYNYFSGNDSDRMSDFQLAIDHKEAKAILCARGGYGTVQIIDKIDFTVNTLKT